MNPIILKIALALVSRKLNSNPEDKQNSDFDAKAAKKVVPAWAAVVGFIVYLASSTGYIDKGLAEAINALISNPQVVEAVGASGVF
jgi:hypothetical protein